MKFTLSNVISRRILDEKKGWIDFLPALSEKQKENFVALFGHGCRQDTKRAIARAANDNFRNVQNCGILGRVDFGEYEQDRVTYTAGQDYPYEIGIVRNWIKKFY
jgi:hypothetical protein